VNKVFSKLAWLLFIGFVLSACQSQPVRPLTNEEGRVFETKAQIKTAQETNTVKIQVALLPQKAIRLEVSATLGLSVASVLVTPSQIQIALHTQNAFITGPFHEKTLYPLFKQNISPRLLWKIIHDQNPATTQLKCELNELQKPISCLDQDGTLINWTYEVGFRRRIDIKNNRFKMNWIFKDQLQLPESQTETFVLKKPESYKEISIK
jgi:hypothetical protein